MGELHTPVMLEESISYLITNKTGVYFEGTLGFGGHTEKILKNIDSSGSLISTDVDSDAFAYSSKKFSGDNRLKLYNFNFSQIDLIAKLESLKGFDGIFADLGVSSFQIDDPEKGFTFRNNSPLDLRMDSKKPLSAADVLNTFTEQEIAKILFEYGEEKNSRRISSKIVERREKTPFADTNDLVSIINELTPPNFINKTLARVFQALRIYVNDELEVLRHFLSKSIELLNPGGRIVIISYHSLEDRIVKDAIKYETLDCICPKNFPVCTCGKVARLEMVTRKPVIPGEEEINRNYRARSAKLRVAQRI